MRRFATLAAISLALLLITVEPAWAWGPGAHIYVGAELLGALTLLPAAIADLMRRFPNDFLYGCIAADITFGKRFAPVGKHCHHWHVGEELYAEAESDATRACALGYLCHLAGDTVAHNLFLPRRLLTSASTQTIGHSYWEHRMDVHLGESYVRAARRLIMEFDHTHNDALFDKVLARTVFSFQTNRRIFRGMIRLADYDKWQAVFDRMLDFSRWDVDDSEVAVWMCYTFDYAADYLVRREESLAAALDPTGEGRLHKARDLRRRLGPGRGTQRRDLLRLAEEHFPLPRRLPGWWARREEAAGIEVELLQSA